MNIQTPKPQNRENVAAQHVLEKYTIVALSILTVVSALAWGLTSIALVIISVAIAVVMDYLFSLVLKRSFPPNGLSAVIFGQIVGLSYSLANPYSFAFGYYLSAYYQPELLPISAPMAYLYVALVSALGMVLFKKLQGLLKRKLVNSAAAAKILVFLPFFPNLLFSEAHKNSILLAGPVGYYYDLSSNSTSLSSAFGPLIQGCYGIIQTRPDVVVVSPTQVFETLTLMKYHGWVGGASSLAVIIVGLSLFILMRKQVKWRITGSYLASVTVMSLVMFACFGGDLLLRWGFEIFIGSSIFLAFFMATDPVTTPNKHIAQGLFGIGLGVLTVLIQTFTSFLGGSILALVIMNLTVPLLDKVSSH